MTLYIPYPRILARTIRRSVLRWRNLFMTNLFPARPWVLLAVISLVVAVVLRADPESWWRTGFLAEILWFIDSYIGFYYLPVYARVGILAGEAAFFGFLILMYLQVLTTLYCTNIV